MLLRAYAKDEKKYGAGLNFVAFKNDQTIPLVLGHGSADRFWTLLRRVGELIKVEDKGCDAAKIYTKKRCFFK